MAQPPAVQKLKHGKALCGATFGAFVETFNWLVDFCQGLKGDKDVNDTQGSITVDRSNPSSPVIRGGRDSSGNSNGNVAGGTWEIHIEDGEASFSNCYYNAAGVTKLAAPWRTLPVSGSGIIAAIFTVEGFDDMFIFASLSDLQEQQSNMAQYLYPLYVIDNGEVVCDLRNTPQLQLFEEIQ